MFFVGGSQQSGSKERRSWNMVNGKEDANEFVCGGSRDGPWRTELATKTAKIVTQRRVAAIQSGSGMRKACEPTAHVAGFRRDDFAATGSKNQHRASLQAHFQDIRHASFAPQLRGPRGLFSVPKSGRF
jgi:hypothetical protein